MKCKDCGFHPGKIPGEDKLIVQVRCKTCGGIV